jgi:hypothetical protein
MLSSNPFEINAESSPRKVKPKTPFLCHFFVGNFFRMSFVQFQRIQINIKFCMQHLLYPFSRETFYIILVLFAYFEVSKKQKQCFFINMP